MSRMKTLFPRQWAGQIWGTGSAADPQGAGQTLRPQPMSTGQLCSAAIYHREKRFSKHHRLLSIIIVVCAADKPPCFFRKPEGFARVSGQGIGAPVFDRYTEDFRAPGSGHSQIVAKGGSQNGPWRTTATFCGSQGRIQF